MRNKRHKGSCPPELFFVEDHRLGFELLYCDFELIETSVDHFGRTILPFRTPSTQLAVWHEPRLDHPSLTADF